MYESNADSENSLLVQVEGPGKWRELQAVASTSYQNLTFCSSDLILG